MYLDEGTTSSCAGEKAQNHTINLKYRVLKVHFIQVKILILGVRENRLNGKVEKNRKQRFFSFWKR